MDACAAGLQDQFRQAIACFAAEVNEGLMRQALALVMAPQHSVDFRLGLGLAAAGHSSSVGGRFSPALAMCASPMAMPAPLIAVQGKDDCLGKVVAGTVDGDLHELRKGLVFPIVCNADHDAAFSASGVRAGSRSPAHAAFLASPRMLCAYCAAMPTRA
ncbi:MAG: hypothetical protein ACYC4R_10320 [Anaerolineae bacterium]